MMLVYMRLAFCGPIQVKQGLVTQQENWNPSRGRDKRSIGWRSLDKLLVYGAKRKQVAAAG
jgi:hypothetical protein